MNQMHANSIPHLASDASRKNARSTGAVVLVLSMHICIQRQNPLTFFMLDWSQCPVVERSPQRVSGAWVFKGTRVPVRALFENLEEGASIDEFLDWFPGVNRDQVHAVLVYAGESLAGA